MKPPPDRLRVLFVTQDDVLYVIRFFEVFFAEYPRDDFEIVGITVARPFGETKHSLVKRMLAFYGPIDFTRALVRYGGAKLGGRSLAGLAKGHGIPILPTTSVNSPEYVRRVIELGTDVVVSVAAPEIFGQELLDAPRLVCLNIHSGRLPRYRGMMPTFWQMLSGESHATVTVHEMAPQLDAGCVLGEVGYPLSKADSLHQVMTETKREGARLMIDVLRRVRSGDAKREPLDMRDASYFSFPSRQKVAEFRRLGHRLL